MITYFFIALITIIYPVKKFLAREDLLVFDLVLFANFLYLFFFPFYHSFTGFEIAKGIVEKGEYVFLLISIYQFIILFVDIFFSQKLKDKTSVLNISYLMKKVSNRMIFVNKGMLFLLTFAVIFLFISNITYANQEGKQLTNTDAIAASLARQNLSVFDKAFNKITAFSQMFLIPGLIYSVTILSHGVKNNKFLKKWAVFFLALATVVLLLGNRSAILNAILFSLTYFYYTSKKKASLRHISVAVAGVGAFVIIFFPIYQGYRLVRNSSLLESEGLTFSMVVEKAYEQYTESDKTKEFLESNTALRSLGAIWSIEETANSNVRYYGEVFVRCMTHILPGHVPMHDNVEMQLATTYHEKGTDVADSYLMYGIADFGFIGPFFAIIYIFIYCIPYNFLLKYTSKPCLGEIIQLFLISSLFSNFFSVETSIFYYFNGLIYSLSIYLILTYSILYSTRKTKKYLIR